MPWCRVSAHLNDMDTRAQREWRRAGSENAGGYVALISVLLLGALLLIIGLGSSLRGISAGEASLGVELSSEALLLADACAEEAIIRLRSDFGYAGGETILIGGSDPCTVVSVSGSGATDRSVIAEADVNGWKRRVHVQISSLSPVLTVLSWSE